MLNIVLDTNTLFKPQDLQRIAARPQHRLWGSVLNIIETISDIVDQKSFKFARQQLRLLREVAGRNLLPDPDRLFRADLGLHVDLTDLEVWQCMIDFVLCADSYEECVRGKSNQAPGAIQNLHVDKAREWRDKYGKLFVSDAINTIQVLNKDADCSEENWCVGMDNETLEALKHYFRSYEAEKSLVESVLARNGLQSSSVTSDMFARAVGVLAHYSRTYQGYLLKIFQDGTKPRQNDYNDLHLTLALWRPGWILLTDERRLRTWMQLGGVAPEKYASVEELARAT